MNTQQKHSPRNINQSGFGVIGILIVVIVLAGLGGAGYYVWSNNSQTGTQEDTIETSQDEDTTTTDQGSQDNDTAAEARQDTDTEDSARLAQLDNAVKTDMLRIMAELNNYAANNNGSYPFTSESLAEFEKLYLTPLSLEHPDSGLPYTLSTSNDDGEYISYAPGECSAEGDRQLGGSDRQISLATTLPSGTSYCIDNS